MVKNKNKGEAYHLVLSNLNQCNESNDVFHLIGLIAACESIMSDRLSAFLGGTNNIKYSDASKKKKFVSLGEMLEFSKEVLSTEIKIKTRSNSEISTKDLFKELKRWKDKRNKVVHAVCKSKSTVSHNSLPVLFDDVQNCCIDGHRLVKLLLKWSNQTKREYRKSQIDII